MKGIFDDEGPFPTLKTIDKSIVIRPLSDEGDSANSETENDLRDDTVTNASRCLGAVRARHAGPAPRSHSSFVLLELPGMEALSSVREGNSEMG